MKKFLFAILLPGLLFIQLTASVFGQTKTEFDDDSGFTSLQALRSDLRMSNITAYVDVKNLKLIDSLGDCENNKGGGYCLYKLEADVKEVFKGKIRTKTVKFFVSPDADYPKNNLMGEQVVFLVRSKPEKGKAAKLGTIENSTRKTDVLEKIRKIAKGKR